MHRLAAPSSLLGDFWAKTQKPRKIAQKEGSFHAV